MESESKLQARLRQQMIELLLELAPNEGYNLSPLPDIRFLRSNRPLTRTPVLYEPGIVIVCQGRKRGYLGDQVYLYDAQRYLVVSVPLPFSMETDASEAEPLLAIYCGWISAWQLIRCCNSMSAMRWRRRNREAWRPRSSMRH